MADEEAGIAPVANISQLSGLYIPSEGCSDEHLLLFEGGAENIYGQKKPALSGAWTFNLLIAGQHFNQ